MLKLTAYENGTLKDEKILVDYEGETTVYGKAVLVAAAFSLIGLVAFVLTITAPFRKKSS